MHGDGFAQVPFDGFPGLTTFGDPLDVPGSPSLQDVDFEPGSVFSRDGTSLIVSLGDTVMSIKEFILLDSTTRRLLVLTASGNFARLSESMVYTLVSGYLGTAVRMKSATLFGREFMGFSADGQIGTERARTYDDVNLDPLSATPPGSAPTFVDSATAGHVATGKHFVRVFYQTRKGFWTSFSPETSWVAAGGKMCNGSSIPIGPPYVVSRIVAFSRSGDSRLFFIPGTAMEIKDNTSTTIVDLDFSDEDLGRKGISVDYLFQMVAIPPAAGVAAYGERICVWGLRNQEVRHGDEGFFALDFNGGFSGAVPNGWTQLTAGGGKSNPPGCVGDCFSITGDGLVQRGRIENNYPAYKVLEPGHGYSVRLRAIKSREGMTGTFHVYVVSGASPAFGVFSIQVDASELSASQWTWIDKELITAAQNVPGADWKLRVSGGGSPGGGGIPVGAGDTFHIDEIEPYPTDEATLPSDVFFSLPGDPESFDFLNGRKRIAPNNGQALRGAFELRGKFYFLKERSMNATADNGDDPAQWTVEEVTTDVGTPSMHGYSVADGWAIIAGQNGPYFFAGGQPLPIGIEITPTWQRINWAKGPAATVWVKIDTFHKRVNIGVPLDSAITPSHVLTARYSQATPTDPSDRKWSLWNIASNCAEMLHESDGTRTFLYGRPTGLVVLDGSTHNDEGNKIDSFYQMPFIGGVTGRKLFGAMTMSVAGLGPFEVALIQPDGSSAFPLQTVMLTDPTNTDVEWPVVRAIAERVSPRFAMSQDAGHWRIRKLALYAKAMPHTPMRGSRR